MSTPIRADHLVGAARRHVPARLVPRVIALRARRAKADPATVALSRQHMRFLLEKTQPDADLDLAVDRYIDGIIYRSEMRWHSDLITKMPVSGIEHLTGRTGGVVLNFMHHGQYDGTLGSISGLGVPLHVVLNSRHFDKAQPAALLQQTRLTIQNGVIPIDATGSGNAIAEKLVSGAIVAIATDVAGKTPLTFAGRRVLGSSGAARLAAATGSSVVLATVHDGGERGQLIRLHAPLLPSDFADPVDLLVEMVRRHEETILAWPEMADQPARRWTILDDAEAFPPPME